MVDRGWPLMHASTALLIIDSAQLKFGKHAARVLPETQQFDFLLSIKRALTKEGLK